MTSAFDPVRRTDVDPPYDTPDRPPITDEALEVPAASHAVERWIALGEVILCSGFPTQMLLTVVLAAAGMGVLGDGGRLSLPYIMTLSLVDAALVLALVWGLLRLHREVPRAIFIGARAPRREALIGVLLIPVAIAVVIAGLGFIQRYAPWLHNVPENPLEALIQTPRDAFLFTIVAIVAGGIREELQRAFVLNRFDQHLGGGMFGLMLFSAAFGAGHIIQGWDAAFMTALLGAFWGAVYLIRRSVVAPVVCHAGFNIAEIVRHLSTN